MTLSNFLQSSSGVMVGSRALGVGDSDSDYDICIASDQVPANRQFSSIRALNAQDYFRMSPKDSPLVGLYLKVPFDDGKIVDIIVYERQSHLDDISSVMLELSKVPKCYLRDRRLRIELFEKGLECRGWIDNSLL